MPKSHHLKNTNDEGVYRMSHKYRGHAIIISQKKFNLKSLATRDDAANDSYKLYLVLNKLGFKIKIKYDPSLKCLLETIKKFAKPSNHANSDCLVVAVLTHGDYGTVYASDDKYSYKELWHPFTDDNCPTLVGKPKIFIIQACSGERFDDDANEYGTTEYVDDVYLTDMGRSPIIKAMPAQPDFLFMFAARPGNVAIRNPLKGSWFVQTLCQKLSEHAESKDIIEVFDLVKQEIAQMRCHTPYNAATDGKRSIPCFYSTLNRGRRLVFSAKENGRQCILI